MGDYVYFFFRETAVEYMNCGKALYARVARVCKVSLELVYIELCHFDVLHFVIEECRHLANGCTAKCVCIGLMLFRYLSYVKHTNFRHKYYRICFGICALLCNRSLDDATVHEKNGCPTLNGGMTQLIICLLW